MRIPKSCQKVKRQFASEIDMLAFAPYQMDVPKNSLMGSVSTDPNRDGFCVICTQYQTFSFTMRDHGAKRRAGRDATLLNLSALAFSSASLNPDTDTPLFAAFGPTFSFVMPGVALVPCMLAGIAGESALYGAYLVMFIACMYAMFFRRRSSRSHRASRPKVNRTILIASLILFTSITSHWVVDVARLFNAFLFKINNPGPTLYYANLSDPLEVTKTGMVVFQMIVGDFTIVYRLWIIWNQNKAICIFPLCTLVGLIVTSVGITYQFTTLTVGVDVFASECGRWITSCCVLSLATNLFCTSMISYRIWNINRNMKLVGASDLTSVIVIVVESAAIYTAWMFTFMVSYLSKSNLQFPFLDTVSPIVGISFSLIIIRVSLGVSHKGMQTTQITTLPSVPSSSNRGASSSANSHPSFMMKPISVTIQQDVVHDSMESHSEEDLAETKQGIFPSGETESNV